MYLNIWVFILQGLLSALSFMAGAYVYRKGLEQSPLFPFNPNKKEEPESTQSWDNV
tara:strand:- start:541 stop:708 length:168 start_codon:yes stop_codon:yes gene_type:complete